MNEDVEQFREIVRQLERTLGMIDDCVNSCCGITLAQCHTLVEIGRASSLSLNELATVMDLDKSTVSRAVDNLVHRNLATRKQDPLSRRNVVISLTQEGRSLYSNIETDMHHYYEQILHSIPQEKRPQLVDSLQLLVTASEKVRCCHE